MASVWGTESSDQTGSIFSPDGLAVRKGNPIPGSQASTAQVLPLTDNQRHGYVPGRGQTPSNRKGLSDRNSSLRKAPPAITSPAPSGPATSNPPHSLVSMPSEVFKAGRNILNPPSLTRSLADEFATPEPLTSYREAYSKRYQSNRDASGRPYQLLELPAPEIMALQNRALPNLPFHLLVQEQDEILSKVNDLLSQSAFYFMAKYQFRIPLEPDKRPVQVSGDREWTEWVFLLKSMASKRLIPARVLYNGQIKQFVTILENSLERTKTGLVP
ncbi:hypothetical protein L228DRAFT_237688 [Xylona heveae TC161]|uniref:Uncharacterized protein n=1 Tax=Xylona heveae (strain CBS 132557 / TC161) TaxID=1328760 RepID=A0A165IEX7_XYLHT|nr:hypothetical protein L228DRAFT_237688 [Xylona heveae TC161]KZF24798.1 hypothetical protein L228DRAFT_237688 [Xylona heveae TC161]